MPKEIVIRMIVEGGKTTPGPSLSRLLGPYKIPVGQVVSEINKQTAQYKGLKVPVLLKINTEDRTFTVEPQLPLTSSLILKEIGKEKGSGKAKHEIIGDISLENVIKIAKMKFEQIGAKTLENAVKTVLGTCVSMGVTVDGKDPKEVQRLISEGKIKVS